MTHGSVAHSSENGPVQGLDSKLKKRFKRPENSKCGISVFSIVIFRVYIISSCF